jgi:hypothetical protein
MRHPSAAVTLEDVAAMNAADQLGRRYELSTDGALSVMPLADSEHAAIASRIFAWLARAGWPAEQLLQAAGVQLPGQDGVGGRIPDLTVWAGPQPRSVWLSVTDLLLVVEIVSPSSALMDHVVKSMNMRRRGSRGTGSLTATPRRQPLCTRAQRRQDLRGGRQNAACVAAPDGAGRPHHRRLTELSRAGGRGALRPSPRRPARGWSGRPASA